jgi:hypothetical protein
MLAGALPDQTSLVEDAGKTHPLWLGVETKNTGHVNGDIPPGKM